MSCVMIQTPEIEGAGPLIDLRDKQKQKKEKN